MMWSRFDQFFQRTRRIFTQPVEELNHAQRALRWSFELARLCWHQLERDRALEMACALAFRTVFALVPLVVLLIVMFRAFGGPGELTHRVEGAVFDFLGIPILQYPADAIPRRGDAQMILADGRPIEAELISVDEKSGLITIERSLGEMPTREEYRRFAENQPKNYTVFVNNQKYITTVMAVVPDSGRVVLRIELKTPVDRLPARDELAAAAPARPAPLPQFFRAGTVRTSAAPPLTAAAPATDDFDDDDASAATNPPATPDEGGAERGSEGDADPDAEPSEDADGEALTDEELKEQRLEKARQSLEPDSAESEAAVQGTVPSSDTQPAIPRSREDEEQLVASVRTVLETLSSQVADQNFKGLGVMGFCLLVLAAVWLLMAVEDSFNLIYNCPEGRSWGRKLIVYWSVLTLGPLSLLAGLSAADWISSNISHWPGMSVLLNFLSRFASLAASWLVLFLLYTLVPNTKVVYNAAAIGAGIAAILWEVTKVVFGLYVQKLLPYAAFYGTFGLIPLFLYWTYIVWVVVLFGLEITYALQTLRGRDLAGEDRQVVGPVYVHPEWVLPVMAALGGAFHEGGSMSSAKIAHMLKLPIRAVEDLLRRLCDARLIHMVHRDGDELSYALARPPESILLKQLVILADAISHRDAPDVETPGRSNDLLRKLADAQLAAAEGHTLEELISADAESAGDAPADATADARADATADGKSDHSNYDDDHRSPHQD